MVKIFRSRAAQQPLWLVVKHENGRMEVLTIGFGDSEALPVFSFEEEAEMFLRLGVSGKGWRARETTAGELISVLYGPCAGARKVALDPLPAEVSGESMLGLASLDQEDFMRHLMGDTGFQLYSKAYSGQGYQ